MRIRKMFSKIESGFTIVELLVVIVVIGILAAVIITTYVGISQKAIKATLAADLSNSAKQIEMYKVVNESYPTANNCTNTQITEICLRPSSGNVFSYAVDNSSGIKTFSLAVAGSGYSYSTNQSGLDCPVNFIIVPGNSTYGTTDFCVMKYEARQANSTTPISQASGIPWNTINQTDSATYSANVEGCAGCHLITNAEWQTIAANVLSVASNWSGGTVGSGYIYGGHGDYSPNSALEADTNDANGYKDTSNSEPSDQRRTLTLTNGEVIWDFAGNMWEWTADSISGVGTQPGIIGSGYAWREYTTLTHPGTFSPSLMPVATGISGANTWTDSVNNIGQIYSSADESNVRYFLRGGSWREESGVLMLDTHASSLTHFSLGFRVAK